MALKSPPDFRKLFRAIARPCLVLDPSFTIIAVSDSFLDASAMQRDDVVSRSIFDIYPSVAGGAVKDALPELMYSLEHVIEERTPHTMPVVRVMIQGSSEGQFSDSYWCPTNSPILDSDGELEYIVHLVEFVDSQAMEDQRRQHYAAIIDTSDDAIFSKTLDGTITSWNPSAERIFGFSEAEAIGKPASFLLPPGREEEEQHILKAIRKGEGIDHFETQRQHKDGHVIDVSVTISPIWREGVVLGSSDIVRDITESKRLTGELDKFFSLSLDMLCISSADGFFKRLSPAFTRTLGWSLEEMLTTPYVEFVHPDDIEPTIAEVKRQVDAGEPVFQFENRYKHKDGSWRILSWNSIPQPGGMMYAVARDVTERRMMELEIRQAREEAERANAAKSEFLSHMSHELRTPLNAVIGFAQLLLMESEDPNTVESANAILKGGRHLLGLINEILDLAKIESGKLTISLESVPVADVLDQAIQLVRPLADQKAVSIQYADEVCGDLHVRADRQRLLQIFLNLITNAAKYNAQGGKVTIKCFEHGKMQRIEIIDNGPGISDSVRRRLFTPFERGSHAEEGTGLGLALSQMLAEIMGGTLILAHSSFAGSTFAVELQRADAPDALGAMPAIAGGKTPETAEEIKIVYIEDNLSNLELMDRVIRAASGYKLYSAMQASVGLQMIRDYKPDLVLLDLHLPDAQGIEVLKELKSDSGTNAIPVVVLSADATNNQIKRLIEAGAKSYLTKPFDLDKLFTELEFIKSSRSKRKLNEVDGK